MTSKRPDERRRADVARATRTIVVGAKRAARTIIERFPEIERPARQLQFLIWRNLIKLRGPTTLRGIVDPRKTLWVSPRDIEYACGRGPSLYKKYRDRGKVEGGDWDLSRSRFEDLDVYRSFVEHFVHGRPWSQTEYYQRAREQIETGFHERGRETAADLDRRCAYLDRLVEQIKSVGYKPLTEVGDDRTATVSGNEDELGVRISRRGELLLEDGHCRLSIAKILGLPQVPVKVTVRHADWFDFVLEVSSYAACNGGKIYNVISHPDLSDVPALHGWDRYQLIAKNLPFCGGTALDIGCHWGFYCHRLEDLGFDVIGIESEPQHAYFTERLRRAERRRFEVRNHSIFDLREPSRFDLVLALYIFHHLIKTRELHAKLVDLLGRVKMRVMVLGCHNPDQPAMQRAYRNYGPDEFVEFVLRHSNLSRAKHIGTEQGRRELYLLEA